MVRIEETAMKNLEFPSLPGAISTTDSSDCRDKLSLRHTLKCPLTVLISPVMGCLDPGCV